MSVSSAAMPALWRHPEFRRGAREMAGVALGISAWGVVAGVAMANSSLGTAWAVVMSLVVFSGTGQIAMPMPSTSPTTLPSAYSQPVAAAQKRPSAAPSSAVSMHSSLNLVTPVPPVRSACSVPR